MPSSVVITACNSAEYVSATLESVLQQSVPPAEIILIDDGSVDGTYEIVAPYLECVNYVYQPNQERAVARNNGVALTTGDYLIFLDGDDVLEPDAIRRQLEAAADHPGADLIAGGYRVITKQGEVLAEYHPWAKIPVLDLGALLLDWPIILHAVLVRREIFERSEGFRHRYIPVEDLDLWLQFGLLGGKMAWNPSVVAGYRWHGANSSMAARRHRQALFATLEDFYADPRVPDNVQAMQRDVWVQKHLDCAAREYLADDVEMAKLDLAAAVEMEPALLGSRRDWLLNVLAFWAQTPWALDGPDAFVQSVCNQLPDELRQQAPWLRHALLSRIAAGDLFRSAAHGDDALLRRAWWKAVRHDPRYLANRGAAKLLLRSLVGAEAESHRS